MRDNVDKETKLKHINKILDAETPESQDEVLDDLITNFLGKEVELSSRLINDGVKDFHRIKFFSVSEDCVAIRKAALHVLLTDGVPLYGDKKSGLRSIMLRSIRSSNAVGSQYIPEGSSNIEDPQESGRQYRPGQVTNGSAARMGGQVRDNNKPPSY
jgi:hypothetical protein